MNATRTTFEAYCEANAINAQRLEDSVLAHDMDAPTCVRAVAQSQLRGFSRPQSKDEIYWIYMMSVAKKMAATEGVKVGDGWEK